MNNFSIFCVGYFSQEGYLQIFSLDYISRIRAGSKRRCQVPVSRCQVPVVCATIQVSGARDQVAREHVPEFRDQVPRQNVKNFHIKNILRLNWNYKLILHRKLQTYKHVLHHAKSFFSMLSLRFWKYRKETQLSTMSFQLFF